jgi:hypothetical protein
VSAHHGNPSALIPVAKANAQLHLLFSLALNLGMLAILAL